MSIEEQIQTLAQDVRELARLHGELARLELRTGARTLITTLFLLGFGVIVGVLVLMAGGVALYFLLEGAVPPAGAAAIVAFLYLIVMVASWFYGWRLMRGAGGVLMPRTREMFSELLQWREKPTDS